MIISLLFIVLSIYIMRQCSLSFDIAANYLTRGFGEGVKGPTINAVASSLPELLISSLFLFYYKDIEGFSAGYGTIIGSSAFNIALIPVISFVYLYFKKGRNIIFDINKSIVKQDAFFLLGSIIILSFGFFFGVNIFLALSLIFFYLVYIFYVIKTRVSKKDNDSLSDEKFITNNNLELKEKIMYTEYTTSVSALLNFKLFRIFFKGQVNKFTSTLVLLISILIIGASCYILVLATEKISHILEINLFFGAFIIAAIASSIPDTIFSIQDAENDKFIDSFSNAYGSNIFDICIGIGFPVLIYTLLHGSINMSMPIDRIGWLGDYIFGGNLLLWSLVILFLFSLIISVVYYVGKLNLKSAIFIFLLYITFITSLLMF